jgi:ATP-binding cassette subfamily B protein
MSAVERLEDPQDVTSVRPDPAIEILTGEMPLAPSKRRLRPLLELAPYIARYRGRAFLALIALTVAAITTLLVPVAARRMIDF